MWIANVWGNSGQQINTTEPKNLISARKVWFLKPGRDILTYLTNPWAILLTNQDLPEAKSNHTKREITPGKPSYLRKTIAQQKCSPILGKELKQFYFLAANKLIEKRLIYFKDTQTQRTRKMRCTKLFSLKKALFKNAIYTPRYSFCLGPEPVGLFCKIKVRSNRITNLIYLQYFRDAEETKYATAATRDELCPWTWWEDGLFGKQDA